MGKIVKYCSSCDEGFAMKFGFCPDCGAPLQAFEMSPVTQEFKTEDAVTEPSVLISNEIDEINPLELADKPPVYDDGFVEDETPLYAENADVIEDEVSEPVYEVPATIPSVRAETFDLAAAYDGPAFKNYEPAYTREDDGGYYVTVIQEKNVKQRNLLLLGSSVLMLTLAVGGTIVSLFQKDLGIGAIGEEYSLAYLTDAVPVPIEIEPQKKDKDESGGGGGGGNENPDPVSKGKMPSMTKDPQMAPSTSMDRLTNPTIPVQMSVKGPERKSDAEKYGYDTSKYTKLSDGLGTGGGIGGGSNGGFGDGRNSGAGTGADGGLGGGNNGGIGDGDGPNGGRIGPPPPPSIVKVTTPLKILAKPRATYTDAARTNNVQGSVLVKVTLLASGQIGTVTAVRGLPHGLTERAIAAARQIKFEPKKINGIPQTVIVTFDYGFNIY